VNRANRDLAKAQFGLDGVDAATIKAVIDALAQIRDR
jgi:hypothetical protein